MAGGITKHFPRCDEAYKENEMEKQKYRIVEISKPNEPTKYVVEGRWASECFWVKLSDYYSTIDEARARKLALQMGTTHGTRTVVG